MGTVLVNGANQLKKIIRFMKILIQKFDKLLCLLSKLILMGTFFQTVLFSLLAIIMRKKLNSFR
jgi:hypothetical protein